MKLYQPSNGTEGEAFISTYCMNCINEEWMHDNNSNKKCEILSNTMIYNVKDKEYPKQWCYKDGKPTCTDWVKWDWDNDGDPDDRNNPKVPINDPDQLMLFSIADDILENHKVKELNINQ